MWNDLNRPCFRTLVASLGLSTISAGELLGVASWLFDASLFGASGLATRMTRLIVVHNRLVNEVCTID